MVNDTLRVVQPSLPLGDPHICSDGKDRMSLISAVYEALVNRDGSGSYSPCLSETWKCSNDATTWEFRIRKDVVFHDSHMLRARDVVASLERVRDPKVGGAWGTQGVYASYLRGARYDALDTYKVGIKLHEPIADLLDLLAEMPIVPEEALDDLPEGHVGSGPYAVNDFDDEEVVMTAHPKHWKGKQSYRKLLWEKESDEIERVKAVEMGGADIATGISPEGKPHVESSITDLQSRFGSMCVIYMLNSKTGPCRDRRVRRALNYALNRDMMVSKIMMGAAELLTGPLTQLHFGWDPDVKGYSHDPATAKQLLREAGYANGLTLKMVVPTESPDEAIPLSKMIVDQFGEIGVETEMRTYSDRPAYAEMVRDKKIGDLCCFDSSPLSTFRVLREKIHSGLKGPWWEGYTNTEVDTLIEQAQRTPDNEKRRDIYRKAYGLISGDAPWLFLYSPEYNWAVKKGINWKPSWDCVVRVN